MAYDRLGRVVTPPKETDMDTGGSAAPNAARIAAGAAAGKIGKGIAPAKDRRPFMESMRILPVLVLVGTATLFVKVNAIWSDVENGKATITISTEAIAAETKPVQVAQASGSDSDQTANAPGEDKNKPLDPVLFTRAEIELLQELSVRRKELDAREQGMIQKEGLLKAAEDRIDKRIKEMEAVRSEIEALITKYDEQEEAQFKSLVQIYEKMKPKDAARIFNELDMDVLLQVIRRMKASKTAPVLANMKAQRAKEITSRIAERKEMPKLN